jgi:hypothetical protein
MAACVDHRHRGEAVDLLQRKSIHNPRKQMLHLPCAGFRPGSLQRTLTLQQRVWGRKEFAAVFIVLPDELAQLNQARPALTLCLFIHQQ